MKCLTRFVHLGTTYPITVSRLVGISNRKIATWIGACNLAQPLLRHTDQTLNSYVTILASIPTSSTSLVFNCGVGVVRTTFAMSAALIVRRRQLMVQGEPDPFGEFEQQKPTNQSLAVVLRAKSEQATRDQSLLRLMNVLQKSEPSLLAP